MDREPIRTQVWVAINQFPWRDYGLEEMMYIAPDWSIDLADYITDEVMKEVD